jgi:hypothetical protein
MEGPCADSEEKREPAGDIDTVVVDGLKVLDPKRPISEADIAERIRHVRFSPKSRHTRRQHQCPLAYASLPARAKWT